MSKRIDSHVLARYKVGKLLGSGAYGHVWKAQDRATGAEVALKKVFGAFRNNIDAQRTYREVVVLSQLAHPNIVRLLQVLGADNPDDLYLVFELMEADLLAVTGNHILTPGHHKYALHQLLSALDYLHSLRLIHRDLKPSNILIDSECRVKVCDFGLVRSLAVPEQEHPILSEQVATRWYRAPELLLGSRSYSYPTDLWSVGCIAAELLTGKPLFEGHSVLEQLEKIIQFSGPVSKLDLQSLDSPVVECLVSQIRPKSRTFADYFSMVDPEFYPLMQGLLQFNPCGRLTAAQALRLPIFRDFPGPSPATSPPREIVPLMDDNRRYSLRAYRKQIYSTIPRPLRAPSDSKAPRASSAALFKNESIRRLSKNKLNSSIIGLPRKKAGSLKPRSGSKPSDNGHNEGVAGEKILRSGTSPILKKQSRHKSPSPDARTLSPYKKQLGLQPGRKDSSGAGLGRFDRKLQQLKKSSKKEKSSLAFRKQSKS